MKNWVGWSALIIPLATIIITSIASIQDVSFFNQKRIVEALILLTASIIFLAFIYQHEVTGINKIIKSCCALFIVLLIVSSSFASLSEWAFLQVGWYVLAVQMVLLNVFLYLQNKKRFIKVLLIGLLVLCILYSTRVYADYIVGLVNENWTIWPQQLNVKIMYKGMDVTPSGFLGFSNVRLFNHLQTWSLPLLVFAYLYFKDRIIRGLKYFLLFFISSWWMLVFAADARGTMIASILSLLLVGLLFKKKSATFLKVYGLTALAGLVLYAVLFLLPESEARQILTRYGDSDRFRVWIFSLEQILEYPILGLGPMHFSYVGIDLPKSTPHNLLLQSATEWGLPAVFIAVGISLFALYKFVTQSLEISRKENDSKLINLRIALIASIFAALIHSMVSGIFNSQLSQLLGAIILGAALGEYFLYSQKELFQARSKKSWSVYLIILLLCANTVFIGIKVWSDIPHLEDRRNHYLQNHNALKLYPRFWDQGFIYKDTDSTSKSIE